MVTLDELQSEIAGLQPPSATAVDGASARIEQLLRPGGALAQLDDLATWIAGWHDNPRPVIERPAVLVFAGDHGVAAEGVSAYPQEITQAMLAAVQTGQASINALAAAAGATVAVFDVGVGVPTGNLRVEPAMTQERFDTSFEAGRQAVRDTDSDLLVLGELGIGNTTAAAAVTAALLGGDVDRFVGRGTGIDDDGWATKVQVVSDAVGRIGAVDPLTVLREVGGTELAAMAGAMFEARVQSIPLLLDGYIATAPALVLHAVDPALVAHVRAGHRSAEPGHALALERLGLDPLLTMQFRLGEGSGAMAAVPLVVAACRAVTDVSTFEEFFGPQGGQPADGHSDEHAAGS